MLDDESKSSKADETLSTDGPRHLATKPMTTTSDGWRSRLAARLPDRLRRPHWTRAEWVAWSSFVIASLAIIIAVFLFFWGIHKDHQRAVAQSHANAAVGAVSTANARLSDHGIPTVEVPTSAAAPTATVTVSGPQGDTGSSGPGPSEAQVAAAVASYCGSHTCSEPPSSSDVAEAVAGYCAAHAGCIGAPGPQGAAGQNATTDQIATAVQAYCSANNSCQGPTGGQGPPGGQGATGPMIPSFTFTVPGVLGPTTYVCSAPDYQCVAQ